MSSLQRIALRYLRAKPIPVPKEELRELAASIGPSPRKRGSLRQRAVAQFDELEKEFGLPL